MNVHTFGAIVSADGNELTIGAVRGCEFQCQCCEIRWTHDTEKNRPIHIWSAKSVVKVCPDCWEKGQAVIAWVAAGFQAKPVNSPPS